MSFKLRRGFVWTGPLLLVTMFSVAGCQNLLTTRTGATRADTTTAIQVCSIWGAVTYSSRDTPETRLEARANNAARDAYCKEPTP